MVRVGRRQSLDRLGALGQERGVSGCSESLRPWPVQPVCQHGLGSI